MSIVGDGDKILCIRTGKGRELTQEKKEKKRQLNRAYYLKRKAQATLSLASERVPTPILEEILIEQ